MDYPTMLLAGAVLFSVLLYIGDEIPWFISVMGGMLSSLFLVALGFHWIGESLYPEMGWIFFLWSAANLIISLVIIFASFGIMPEREPRDKYA